MTSVLVVSTKIRACLAFSRRESGTLDLSSAGDSEMVVAELNDVELPLEKSEEAELELLELEREC